MTDAFLPHRVQINGLELAYLDVGSGSETVVFSHSYLVDSRQFEAQIETLATTYRVVAYDHRDHGASQRATAAYGLTDLVSDGVKLLEELDAVPCHWVGLSTGGFVGMRAALQHPDWFRTLTLMDTSATADEPLVKLKNRAMLLAMRLVGIKPLAGAGMKMMFGDAFLDGEQYRDTRETWRARILANDPAALIRFGKAILGRDNVLEDLRQLPMPVNVIAGSSDRALPVKHARAMAEAIPGANISLIDGAGHLCTIECPDEVCDVLTSFIGAHTGG